MHRSTLSAGAAALLFAAASGSTGCQVAPLPEGYSWDVRPASDLAYAPSRSGGATRSGFQASRVDAPRATTRSGRSSYDFAAALPGRPQPVAPAAGRPAGPDLSPPRSLFAEEADPVQGLFGSPAPRPRLQPVVVAPTPVAGRNAGVATHTVARGDSLWSIASRVYGSGLRYVDLIAANPGINPERLKIGDRLVLPGVAAAR